MIRTKMTVFSRAYLNKEAVNRILILFILDMKKFPYSKLEANISKTPFFSWKPIRTSTISQGDRPQAPP
jgi:hypothetical protein